MLYLAAPAAFVSVCHYSLTVVTQMFAGQIGTLELAAVSVQNSAVAGLSFAVLVGMGSALQTLCGQAYGAGKLDMMGIYMQQSWLILVITSTFMIPFYIYAGPVFRLIGIPKDVSLLAGKFTLYLIPQLFTNAIYFPVVVFLQAQNKIVISAVSTLVTLCVHSLLCWLAILKLGWGLKGAAVVLNFSYLLNSVALVIYIFNGACGNAWCGFSWMVFRRLSAYVRLSAASAVMLCLELWYLPILILFAGHLKDPKISLDALSISMNILSWAIMISVGFSVATSIRVSNELGAGNSRNAKLSVVATLITSTVVGLIISIGLIVTRNKYPTAFTSSLEVQDLVHSLNPLLALTIIINYVQPMLSGVAIGAGWQAMVAYVNIGCYYIFGIPVGIILGFKLHLGVKGIWYGMLSGTLVQTFILICMVCRTDWNKEATIAMERVKHWGEPEANCNERRVTANKRGSDLTISLSVSSARKIKRECINSVKKLQRYEIGGFLMLTHGSSSNVPEKFRNILL